MKFSKILLAALIASGVLTGCATTGNIAPQYVNPTTYQNYNCEQLQSETARIGALVEKTKKQQLSLSSTGIGIGLAGGRHGIYPTISLGMGTGSGQRAAKNNALAKLYGEHDAMIVAARQKNCSFAEGVKIYGE
ncbi:hypothetical protein SAMN02745664_11625 [Moraxella cuniculi DSM 21768]|uniref:Lipoprotein n=2 Tax=Moraxella cuniculi TaxID=34061 RepID=A0A1N7FRJ0_9GAMM|nr:hypothetical protein [Moraxella cuniculi]OOS08369.1 hypothetical protein B0189_00165 [Moraxella cuniculi]SIS02907.1 hypothetical protein SAMN02745664_11625 [Moraxella cuniculi DSM 21768]VEG12735.1 Uncharacterised protein [Moraxella cuniculi]